MNLTVDGHRIPKTHELTVTIGCEPKGLATIKLWPQGRLLKALAAQMQRRFEQASDDRTQGWNVDFDLPGLPPIWSVTEVRIILPRNGVIGLEIDTVVDASLSTDGPIAEEPSDNS